MGYLIRDAGIGSLEEIAYFDVDGVEILIKRWNRPGGTTAAVSVTAAMTIPHVGYAVSSRAVSNLEMLCVLPQAPGDSVPCAYFV
jgi:NaMN:DMB phosphoribosyltransferase